MNSLNVKSNARLDKEGKEEVGRIGVYLSCEKNSNGSN